MNIRIKTLTKTPRLKRDKKYLAWIRKQSCLVTGARPEHTHEMMHAHHVRMGGQAGIGQKPSDYRTVPLLASEHDCLHNSGEKLYWQSEKTDPEEKIAGMMLRYLRDERGLRGYDILMHLEQLMEND